MSNAEKEWQAELLTLEADELRDMVHHFRNLSFDLHYKLNRISGSCEKCNTPLKTFCWHCQGNKVREVEKMVSWSSSAICDECHFFHQEEPCTLDPRGKLCQFRLKSKEKNED